MSQNTTKIYNSSKDTVLIKKIGLRIWSLRDEVKATVKSDLSRNKISVNNPNLTSIIQEYTTGKIVTDDAGTEKEVSLGGLENPATDKENQVKVEEQPAASEEKLETTSEEKPTTDTINSATPEPAPETDADELAMAQAIAEEQKETNPTESIPATAERHEKNHILQRIPQLDPEEIAIGRAMLSEINMERMFFFCEKKFMEGQAIVIEFLVPKRFVLNAEVHYCMEFNLKSRIISKNRLPYRTIVKFTFLKEGERTLLRDFVKSISPQKRKGEIPA